MTTSWPDRLIEGGALFLLVFTPLAYGTVEPWSEAVVELVVLGMAVTYMIGSLRDWELRVELPPGSLPVLLLLLLVVLQAVVPGWSVDPHATLRQALKLLAVAAFFLICWNTYRTRGQAQRALWTMIAIGTVLAVFGIVQRVTWNGHLYWVGPDVPGSAFGPFVNRTHFAGLMVIVVPVALAFVLASHRREARRQYRWHPTWRDRLREWNSRDGSATKLTVFLVLVMGGAALVSGSRGGVLALLAALAALVLGSLAGQRTWSGWAARLAFATALIVLAGAWISSDILYGTVARLAEEVGRPAESPRLQIWSDALALWHSAPILGTGLATFGVAFPRFRTIEAPVTFTHAESDWVQLLTDTGLLGLGLALTAVLSLALALTRRYRDASAKAGRLFSLASLVALLGSVVQGVGNYNLPVMSSLIYLGLALALVVRLGDVGSAAPGQKPSTATS
jgi:O-antigen ligase